MVSSRKKTSSISRSRSRSPPSNKSGAVELSNGRSGCSSEPKDGNLNLWPVEAYESGEGSPYAPKDWPNPGDNWRWRVGRRVTSTGHFADRFLYLPSRLQNDNSQPYFLSKVSVERFIQAEFPNADLNDFFASFSWKVPAKLKACSNSKPSSACEEFTSPKKKKRVQNEAVRVRSKNRKKRAGKLLATYRRRTRQSLKTIFSSSKMNNGGIIDLCSLNDSSISTSTSKDPEERSSSETDQVSPVVNSSPRQNSNDAGTKLDLQIPHKSLEIAEDFDKYLNSLDDILAPPDCEAMPTDSTNENIPAEDETAESRKKLSALLVMDFPTLASTENLLHIAALVSKIQEDPSLSVDQLIKLKLIEEIPLIGKAFIETRETFEKSDKFFADLDANKTRVSSLKEEYNNLKETTSMLQDEIDLNASLLGDIDKQIAQLQSRREEISSIIKTKKKENSKLISTQNSVANSIPVLVRKIKEAYSEKSEWETKKITSAQRETEILAKFASLKGYSL